MQQVEVGQLYYLPHDVPEIQLNYPLIKFCTCLTFFLHNNCFRGLRMVVFRSLSSTEGKAIAVDYVYYK